jgi:hypothetical protein
VEVVPESCPAVTVHSLELLDKNFAEDRGKQVPPALPDVRSQLRIFGKIFESILLLAQAWALALGRTVSETRAFWTSQVASLSVRGWQQLSRDKAAATGREAHPDVWDQRAPVDWLQIIEPSMFSTDTSGTKHRTGKPRNGNVAIVQNFARSLSGAPTLSWAHTTPVSLSILHPPGDPTIPLIAGRSS